ncbi:MAG: RHS repeat domain-containing protein, partial [Acidobacteriota bacterium]
NRYFVTRVSDANGDLSYSVVSQTNEEVARARGSADGELEVVRYLHDGAGRLTHVLPPMGVAALHRGDPQAERWATRYAYDFSGRMVEETTPDSGTSRFVHDPLGNTRFAQDAQSAADGHVLYTKYDGRGRILEEGYFEGTWDRPRLLAAANTEPGWPDAGQPHTVRVRHDYDGGGGDGDDPTAWGRLTRTRVYDAAGAVTTEQTFRYDARGRLAGLAQSNPSFDDGSREVTYGYDGLGAVTRIGYPDGGGVPEVIRSYDSLGQLAGVGVPGDPAGFISYRYDAAGGVVGARQPLDAGVGALERTSTYTPAGWPETTRFQLPGGREVFGQELSYTGDGAGGSAYFDGKIAASRIT